MGVRFFIFLLIISLAGFFGLQQFTNNFLLASDIRILGFSILTPGFRFFLGACVVFCEFAIIFFSMLDKIGEAIKAALVPVVRLIPMGAFIAAVFRMFSPLLATLMPETAARFGAYSAQANMSQAIQVGVTGENVLLTLLTMLLFYITFRVLSAPRAENPQVKDLQARLQRCEKQLKAVLD
jgi:hypothetical protein